MVPTREKRMAAGETDSASLAGWYAETDSGSSGSEDGGLSQESEDGLCGMSGK